MEECIYEITIKVEPDGEGYYAYCPRLPGVLACGDSEEEAIRNAKDGAIGIISSKLRFGDEIKEKSYLKKGDKYVLHEIYRSDHDL
ncbi:MAG: type II toxin-antitoxin system HicB family antitoxin [Candidatus Latescibacter sp.]|nr:type II toxin-antitoxin system HicB family antitoxin [Candidatus Latescibacter sp.]